MSAAVLDIANVETVVLVEGVSDQRAVEALAQRSGRDLRSCGVAVVPMGGATNIGRYLADLGPNGRNLKLAGLCDAGEVRFFRRALQLAFDQSVSRDAAQDSTRKASPAGSVGNAIDPADPHQYLAARHFFVCSSDLEDELVRALGVHAVEQLLDKHSDLRSFRTFQQQPDQQGKSDSARLRRFMGTRGGRKIEYAPLLVNTLPENCVPEPLAQLLASI